jgi:hypothetical protein
MCKLEKAREELSKESKRNKLIIDENEYIVNRKQATEQELNSLVQQIQNLREKQMNLDEL